MKTQSTGTGGGGGGGGACFAADTLVRTDSGRVMHIEDVRINDMLLTFDGGKVRLNILTFLLYFL